MTSIGLIAVAVVSYLAKANIYIIKISAIIYGVYLILIAFYYFPYYKFKFEIINKDYDEHIENFKKLLHNNMPNEDTILLTREKFEKYWINSLIIIVTFIVLDILTPIFTSDLIVFTKSLLAK